MSVSVKMPQLGESVTEGIVTRWLKKEGDEISSDEPLLEVSTDKVDTEIPAPATGVLLRILAHEDETVAVGAELAVIGEANEAPLRSTPDGVADAAATQQSPPQDAAAETTAPPASEATASEPEPAAAQQDEAPQPVATPEATAASAGSGAQTPIVLPALGESVTEGTVTRWLKQVGDSVTVDEPLVEVSTDKVDTEIPSPVAGTLVSVAVAEDQTVEVGATLGVIGATSAGSTSAPATEAPRQAEPETQPAPPAPAPPAPAPPAPAPPAPAAPAEPPSQQPAAASTNGSAPESDDVGYVTPLVRKLAAEYAVDLGSVKGTGVGGRIRKQDVLEAAKLVAQRASQQGATSSGGASAVQAASTKSPQAPSPLRGRTEQMSRLRKVIAERMVNSLQTSAQLTTVIEADVTRIANLRDRAKGEFVEREGVKLSFLPFFAKATVEALKVHPSLNANVDTAAGTVTYHDSENLGIAVDTERGLLVPVVRDAGDLNIAGLARRIADIADRTRASKISPDELSGGTFTLTNTGSRGALFDTPIINQPQVGILGTGVVVKRPVVVTDDTGADSIAVRSMVYLALTYDHRIVDGADAARFLLTLKARLEEGAFETDLGL
jgi:2-oxoglutarate dehydrogenase E2 component (dihydrolipoamide succinyltransferase)